MVKLFNQDYLLSLCKTYGLSPSKKYGQNYLLDETVIERMVAAAGIGKSDTVIEVGPGFGVLTLALVKAAKQVISYEIEKKLEPYWAARPEIKQNLSIVWGNALRAFKPPTPPYKIVANLPYQITSAVIRLFLETIPPPELMVLMVQKEVAERIAAKAGDMSLLSVSVQYYAAAEIVTQVHKTSFWPSPAVDSAVIRLIPHRQPISESESKAFFKLVRLGFSNRRKLLIKNIASLAIKKSDLPAIFEKMGLSPTVRAQELSISNWKELAKHLLLEQRS